MRKVIAMVLDKPYAVIDVEDGKSLNEVRIELLEQGYPGSVYCISTYEYELIFELLSHAHAVGALSGENQGKPTPWPDLLVHT